MTTTNLFRQIINGYIYRCNSQSLTKRDVEITWERQFRSVFYTSELKTPNALDQVSPRESFGNLQVIPHITDAIQDWIERVSEVPVDGRNLPADVCVIELGGVVGNHVCF